MFNKVFQVVYTGRSGSLTIRSERMYAAILNETPNYMTTMLTTQTAPRGSRTPEVRLKKRSKSTGSRKRKSSRNTRQRLAWRINWMDYRVGLTTFQHSSGNKQAEQDADKESDEKLKEIKGIGGKTGDKVVDDLLKAVVDVRPEVPNRVEQAA